MFVMHMYSRTDERKTREENDESLWSGVEWRSFRLISMLGSLRTNNKEENENYGKCQQERASLKYKRTKEKS